MRRLWLLVILFALPLQAGDATVTLLHFSDYHSHALPFYTDDGERGGIARAIGYLKSQKRVGALVFNGGDTVNKGAPAWSDKYTCSEWRWLNGVVDAMAFGNHDADYGFRALEECRAGLRYPILSANTSGFPKTAVLDVRGVRIGVFAVAGTDFRKLVQVPELEFGDPVAAAREAVRSLREEKRVQAVVMIGHEDTQSDYALARAVPGIDVIFGTHSHLQRELVRIPETSTWFISPSQYLTFISRVELTFSGGKVSEVKGSLVPVDASLPLDADTERKVTRMQRALENDPEYRDLFVRIGSLDAPLSTEALGLRSLDVMRDVTKSDLALSTRSSFRRPLPAGTLTLEQLRGAMPYDNEIVTCTIPAAELSKFLDAAGPESYVAGAASPDPSRDSRLATTDYVAFVAFKDALVCEKKKTGLRVRDELTKRLAK